VAQAYTVAAIAAHVGGDVEGESDLILTGVCGLEEASESHLSFLSNRRYRAKLANTAAGCVLVDRRARVPDGMTVIRCDDPYAAFAMALRLFNPQHWPTPGVDSMARVDPSAVVEGACIEAFAWVGPGAVVGPGSWVEAGVRIGAHARVGRDCRLMANSVLCDGCELGDRVWLNPGAVVGSEGFGFAPTASGNLKIPQVGRAIVEDDVELGANTCVDRAAMSDTRVGRGTKTDNLVQVGHAAQIGQHGLMVAYSGVAGSSKVGNRVVLAAKAAVLGHLNIGDGVQVGVASAVHGDVEAGSKVTGIPAIPHRQWLRSATAFSELPGLLKQVRQLTERVGELQAHQEVDWVRGGPPSSDRPEASVSDPTPLAAPLDIQQLLKLLPHRYPFLMIDRVMELVPGERAVGIKCVSVNEPHFQGHFPNQPIMPGVLITEAFAQLAGIVALSMDEETKGQTVYMMGLDKIRFRSPVVPGDQLVITCEKVFCRRGVWRFEAFAEVEGQRVSDGFVMATVADNVMT